MRVGELTKDLARWPGSHGCQNLLQAEQVDDGVNRMWLGSGFDLEG